MHDAEMMLGLHRHLTAYSVVPATSALGELQFAGKLYELAFRLRGSGVSSRLSPDSMPWPSHPALPRSRRA